MLELPLTKFGFAFYLEPPPVAAERRENLPHKEASVKRVWDGRSQASTWPFLPRNLSWIPYFLE